MELFRPAMSVDTEGGIWIGSWATSGSVYYVKNDPENQAVQSVQMFWPSPDVAVQICAGDVVWMTTLEGRLVLHDYRRSLFELRENDEPVVYSCYLLPDGRLLGWEDNRIKIFAPDNNLLPQFIDLESGKEIIQVRMDATERLWVLFHTGECYSQQKNDWTYQGKIPLGDSEEARNFWFIDGSLFFSTTQRLLQLQDNQTYTDVLKYKEDEEIREIVQDKQGRIWMFGSREVFRREITGQISSFPYPASPMNLTYDPRRDLIYIATERGLYSVMVSISR